MNMRYIKLIFRIIKMIFFENQEEKLDLAKELLLENVNSAKQPSYLLKKNNFY